ncbi:MAG: glycosyltransferase family 4 protein [Mucilaginibacter polytrichastri]|nr:glycosyltransferase family 4 protein [Mucilaginibacter polytrichastri]
MKIAITADPELPVPPLYYGGIERIIHMLVSGLHQRGHEVTLFAHKDSQVNCKLIPYTGTGLLNNMLTINRELLTGRYGLVHSFGRLLYLLPVLPRKIRKIMSYQREPTLSQIKKATILAGKNTLSFTGCSDYISRQIQPFAPAVTIYNGIETDRYHFVPVSKDDSPLVFLGRIEPIKGPHIAIDLAKKTGNRLIIAGNIPVEHQKYFADKIRPHLNADIVYAGPVNDQQKNDLLGQSKALLMPIQWNEPFGIVMIEAMACGTPVIGFNRGAVPEVVDHGKTGFYSNSPDDLVSYIQNINSIDRSKVRRAVEIRFSAEVITDQYEALYLKVLGR